MKKRLIYCAVALMVAGLCLNSAPSFADDHKKGDHKKGGADTGGGPKKGDDKKDDDKKADDKKADIRRVTKEG